MPYSVFISYSHRDRELRGELEKHLKKDQIILLLISADFMDSDFCYSIEMARAIASHDADQARVLPIILRPTDWKGAPFAKLKVLPADGKPVTSRASHDEAFVDVVRGIREAIEDLTKKGIAANP
jgi:hypothetical protein